MSNYSRREALTRFGLTTAALAVPSLFSESAFASYYRFQGEGLKTTKLSDKLYLIDGGGGNVVVVPGEMPVVIDSKLGSVTDNLISELGKLSSKNTAYVINTHWHFDHVGSNVALGKAGAQVVAHQNTLKRLSTDQVVEFMNVKSAPLEEAGRPHITFTNDLSLSVGGETLKLQYLPDAHTDTDVYVHFQNANVLHCGDLFFNGLYPFIDYSSKGWIGGMVSAASKLLKVVDNNTKIVPGHGPVTNKAGLQAFHDMLEGIHQKVEPMVKKGMTENEVVAAKPTAAFDAKWGGGFLKADQFSSLVYRTIKRHNG